MNAAAFGTVGGTVGGGGHLRFLRSWWHHQPPAAFAFVMATGIVSAAMGDAGWGLASRVLLWIAVAGLVLLTIGLVGRLITNWKAAVADFRNPHAAFGYLTVVAGMNVVGSGFHDTNPTVTWTLGIVSFAAWLFLAYGVPLSLMVRLDGGDGTRHRLLPVDGTWFLWVVSTQSLSIATANVAADVQGKGLLGNAAVAFWGIGIMLYLTLTTLVLLRLLTGGEKRGGIEPADWMFMGATAITVLAGSMILHLPSGVPVLELTAPAVGGISFLLWAFGLWWVPLLVAFGIWRHMVLRLPLRYATALWSIVFPLGMFSVATYRFGTENGLPWVALVGQWGNWVAVLAWLLVAVSMAAAALSRVRRGW